MTPLPLPDRGWLASPLTLNLVLFCQGHFLCEYLLPWPSQLLHQFCDNLDTSNGTGYLCAAAHQSQVLAYYSILLADSLEVLPFAVVDDIVSRWHVEALDTFRAAGRCYQTTPLSQSTSSSHRSRDTPSSNFSKSGFSRSGSGGALLPAVYCVDNK